MTQHEKHFRPSLEEVRLGMIYRYVPFLEKKRYFSPTEILAMHDFALKVILDLSDEGIENIKAEARWLERRNRKMEYTL